VHEATAPDQPGLIERAKEKIHEMTAMETDANKTTGEKVKEKAHEAKEKVLEKVDEAKDKLHDMTSSEHRHDSSTTMDTSTKPTMGEQVKEKAHEAKEKVVEKVDEAKDKLHDMTSSEHHHHDSTMDSGEKTFTTTTSPSTETHPTIGERLTQIKDTVMDKIHSITSGEHHKTNDLPSKPVEQSTAGISAPIEPTKKPLDA